MRLGGSVTCSAWSVTVFHQLSVCAGMSMLPGREGTMANLRDVVARTMPSTSSSRLLLWSGYTLAPSMGGSVSSGSCDPARPSTPSRWSSVIGSPTSTCSGSWSRLSSRRSCSAGSHGVPLPPGCGRTLSVCAGECALIARPPPKPKPRRDGSTARPRKRTPGMVTSPLRSGNTR